ncbi:MAG: hypothetical protein ABFS46_04375 [Myxococcota bacterium]
MRSRARTWASTLPMAAGLLLLLPGTPAHACDDPGVTCSANAPQATEAPTAPESCEKDRASCPAAPAPPANAGEPETRRFVPLNPSGYNQREQPRDLADAIRRVQAERDRAQRQ